jgi:membrane-bound lytic murein transglycosylase MltF
VQSPLDDKTALPERIRSRLNRPFTGDLDEMVKRRMIRVGVTYNLTQYFVDKGVKRGADYEYLKSFEDTLNRKLKTGNLRVHVVFVPLARDRLFPALLAGSVDLIAAILTITPERRAVVDFSIPTRRHVSEIVVTGPGSPSIKTVEELSGHEVFTRKSSSYYHSLLALNQRLRFHGLKPVVIHDTPENLEDEDLLQMVNAGLMKIIVVDNYLANFWGRVLPDLAIHQQVAVRSGGELALAFRKHSPQLAAAVNAFIAKHGMNTVFGRVIEQRYLQNTTFVRNAGAGADRRRFESLLMLFRKYSGQYQVDYLLMAAQGYHESRLDQRARSRAGAIGVMQVLPATGKMLQVGDIRLVEPNIHAGVKYVRLMMDRYFASDPMDDFNKELFTFASYNAGPTRIRTLQREAKQRGLNPEVWFGNVEWIVSERVGLEPVNYVSNIYKYYVAYRLVVEEDERRRLQRHHFTTQMRGRSHPT